MRKRPASLVLLIVFTLGLLFIGGQPLSQGVVLAASAGTCPNKVTITANTVNIRANNGQFNITEALKRGEAADILNQLGNWYTVKISDGCLGRIFKWYGKPAPQQPTPQEPAPQEPAPEQPAPQEPAPEEPAPEEPAPEQPVPEEPAPQEPTPQEPAPEEPAPEQPAPQEPAGLSTEQSRMLELVNAERAKAGLNPLKWDAELANVANIKAKDMVDNNYFSHTSPTYGSPFDMMKRFGIQYRTAGENLAGYSSVEGAHNGLMNSEGHRKNILNSSFTHIGIGVQKSPRYGYVFVQMFVGR